MPNENGQDEYDNYGDDDCDAAVDGGELLLTPPSLSLFSLAWHFALSVSAVLTRIELNLFSAPQGALDVSQCAVKGFTDVPLPSEVKSELE